MVIIPLFSSVFTDTWRLVFLLVGHPLLLELCLYLVHVDNTGRIISQQSRVRNRWRDGGKEYFGQLMGEDGFIIEAILVFDRRFLIGQVQP